MNSAQEKLAYTAAHHGLGVLLIVSADDVEDLDPALVDKFEVVIDTRKAANV